MTFGIVVGGVDVGEAHRILRLLTPDRGRISVMVRNARASKRRYAGILDPGTELIAHLTAGRGSLPILSQAEARSSLDKSRGDLERLGLALYGCELVSSLAPEEHEATKLFTLLQVWLAVVEGEVAPSVPSRIALEGKTLTFAGVAPALVRCSICGKDIDDPAVFDALGGGAAHQSCGSGGPVAAEQLVLFEALRRTPLRNTVGPHPVNLATQWLLSDFAQHQLGHSLKSRSMLGV